MLEMFDIHLRQGDVPLQLERELLASARGFVFSADENIIEQEEVTQLPISIRQLHREGVLDEMSLVPLPTVRVKLSPVLQVVVVEKVLDHVK